ncbi:LAETG motif-containing sortase-dependent surface protein [Streptomyces fradiae]|uniref:LAETG motif-containing sortase-dependent surface protein n=1 Tax=Streptomyces fradiae TaxID=1906 RepID=UPI003511450B
MSVARRPLLTATAAGTLLCALWFVPNANATGEQGRDGAATQSASAEDEGVTGAGTRLAETGGPNTTPYLLGGSLFLGVGAGFVTLAMRRGGRAS